MKQKRRQSNEGERNYSNSQERLTPSLDNPTERLIITFSIKANNSRFSKVHYDVGAVDETEKCETMRRRSEVANQQEKIFF